MGAGITAPGSVLKLPLTPYLSTYDDPLPIKETSTYYAEKYMQVALLHLDRDIYPPTARNLSSVTTIKMYYLPYRNTG